MYGDNDSDGVDVPAGRVRGVNDDIVPSVGFLAVGVNDINSLASHSLTAFAMG